MQRTAPTSDRQRIIALYAQRQPTYPFKDVLPLLGISDAQLRDAISRGVIATETNDLGQQVIAWAEVAALALEEWTPRMIEAALHHEADDVPLLNQHRLIRVSLPIYQIRLLDHLARVASATRHVPRNASDILEHLLHDVANAQNTTAIDAEVPGYAQALTYPYFVPRRTGVLWLRCRYCGISITEPVREVCRTCEAHHEPNEHLGEYGIPELEEPDDHPTQPPTTLRDHQRSTDAPKRRKRRASS